ncbi:glutathione peroxidase [Salinimicrobium oceani]|uniref:Glutathione peroxidase n=1 Tax=Salinimicrobium oceani TaxID=2722702 RepID=A0ABX1CW36_9FLAO|nr:glutathione peroxidase [Salinimicrobium oceani]NJW52505.1 glutathione peroxidase [Salinimicrobium oceani]
MSKIYDFKARDLQGKEVDLEMYRDKVILVVNTASECGFTPQFEGLENLYKKYKSQGLVILGFPCNQFGKQEPGDEKSIAEGCMVNYGVSFPMFSKVEVNGKEAHPLFKFLKKKQGGLLGSKIKWNFTKFLIDREGEPVKRFAPITKPESIEEDIRKLL